MNEIRCNRLFNIYGEDRGTGYAGNVWDVNGLAPTLTTMGGGNREPMVVVDEKEKKRKIDKHTPIADMYRLGEGRYALNARNGIACTLTGAHHFAGNITHPRQGFREMGVLEVIYER